MFSCQLPQRRLASLCAHPAGPPFQKLTYRYGTLQRLEMTWSAPGPAGETFFSSVGTAAPKASVYQVGFRSGPFFYALSECVGGSCPSKSTGLLVQRGERVILARRCLNAYEQEASFPSTLVEFGPGTEDGRSNTPLIKPEFMGLSVERLFPIKGPF